LAWVALMAPLYKSDANFAYAELWKYTDGTFISNFVSAYDISDIGTSGNNTVLAGQEVYVFRTSEGGIMKVNLMETITNFSFKKTAANLTASQADLVAYVIDTALGNYFMGRDTSYPFAFVAMYPGQNEAIFKKRYRAA